jgi:hypothetical protein
MDRSYLAARARARDREEKEWGERDRGDLGPLVEKKASKSLHSAFSKCLASKFTHAPANSFPKLSCFQASTGRQPNLFPNCLASKHWREVNQLPRQGLKWWRHWEIHWPANWWAWGINSFVCWKMATIVGVGLSGGNWTNRRQRPHNMMPSVTKFGGQWKIVSHRFRRILKNSEKSLKTKKIRLKCSWHAKGTGKF